MNDVVVKDDCVTINDYSQLDKILQEYFKDKPDFSIRVKANHVVKRTLDVVLGTIGLIISTPIIATMGLITLQDSGSPAFFKQERIGYRGEHINIYKIRVMHDGMEEKMLNGKISFPETYSDSNIFSVYTKIGRILDYTHLNELPQLWNVVKGEMSIVGNRPICLYFVKKFINIPEYIDRFDSIPGLFGNTQIRSKKEQFTSEVIAEEKNYSRMYTKGNILLEDFKIMCKTLQMYYRMCTSNTARKCVDAAT